MARPNQNQPQPPRQQMAVRPASLEYPAVAEDSGIDKPTWLALQNLYPGAHFASQIMVFEYCKARHLDVLKKPVHIVPMYIKDAITGQGAMQDVVMPGITETRITAARTNQFAGQDEPKFGKVIAIPVTNSDSAPADVKTLSVPESCTVTVYRLVGGKRYAFTYTEFFEEAVARTNTGLINSMWTKRPRGQLAKCATAGALRMAFPEELGGEPTAEEMLGQEVFIEPAGLPAENGASGIPEPQAATQQGDDVVDAEFTDPTEPAEIPDPDASGLVDPAMVKAAEERIAAREAKAESKPKPAPKPPADDVTQVIDPAVVAAAKAEIAAGGELEIVLPEGAKRILDRQMDAKGITAKQLLAKLGQSVTTVNINQALGLIKEWA